MTEQVCPRRAENPASSRYDAADNWEGSVYFGQVGPRCSYCGSLSPDRFLELVREGWIVGPTDKFYKAYLESPVPGRRGKFYFQHLSKEQRAEFVELHNSGEMKLGFPGHFYVVPYFTRKPPE